MKRLFPALLITAACGFWLMLYAQLTTANEARLWHYRNLGKAFYENPTTQKQAVEEFRQALSLAPNSPREQLNYGIALLRAGDLDAGIAQLEKVQKLAPALPHTWFNLGVAFQKQGEFDRAFPQFQEMIRLVPKEPVSHYHLGALQKLKGDTAAAVKEFETARDLNPRLAAPHFQLYGLYRQSERPQDAAAELRIFQDVKKQQEGAAVPEDMDWSFYSEIYDPLDAPRLPPPAPSVYRDEKLGTGFEGVTVLALDGVRPSLIGWSRERVAVYRNGNMPAPNSGLEALRDVVFIAPGDFDNDGLPDLCVITTKGAVLYRNVNGKLQKQADLATGSFRKALWLDYDHDYDPDLFLLGDDSRLLRNNGEAGFSDETRRFPFAAGRALELGRFEVEPDTPGFDFLVNYEGGRTVLYRDRLSGVYEASDSQVALATAEPAVAADFSGNGRLDSVVLAKDGALTLRHDVTPNYGNWTEIALSGVKNAKLALDAKIEVKAGTFYEKAIYRGTPVVFRLGTRTQVDTIRITWPNGLIQNETGQAINRVTTVKEAPRLSGSCPMIFTWNGQRFEFITDVLGVAPLGASSGDSQYFPVDHDEYVSIPGERLKPRNGQYEIRVTEELREVSYIDQIKLIALDHPAAIDIVTNEKFKSPPFPEFRLFGVDHRIYPVTAVDDQGHDVLPAIRRRDQVYPDAFSRDHAGVAALHRLDLNFGSAAPANRAVLVLSGWVDWADGSTFLAAMQAHKDLTFPYIQVKDAAGNWKTVIEDMGIPSGKPKTMAVDLTGKFLSASREVRIVTNLCVYWDEIFLVEDNAAPASRLTTVPNVTADLHFRGFSNATIHPERKQPEKFDYQTVSFTSMWNPTGGNYTRYGPVEALLAEPDDRMAIMGSGDELRLLFDGASLPDLPAGWKRDFLLLVDGWAKDADANTAFSQTVLPLPFHGMSRYPYPAGEKFPDDAVHMEYLREYNTRPALRLIRGLTDSVGGQAGDLPPLGHQEQMMRRIPTLALAFLLVNSAYIAAFPRPTVFYMANVLLHLALGVVGMIVCVVLVAGKNTGKSGTDPQTGNARGTGAGAFLAAGVPAVYLAVRGNTMPHQWILWLHIGLAVIAVVIIAFRSTRFRTPLLLAAVMVLIAAAWPHSSAVRIVNPAVVPVSMDEEGAGARSPFAPSSAQTNTGQIIPSNFFMDSESCGQCHKDIYEQWKSSMHHFASFNNQFYRKSIEYMQDVAGTRPSKWCAGCHDHAVFFNGRFDRPIREQIDTPEAQAGLGCMSCHAIVHVGSSMGNADFTVEYPPLHELANSHNRYIRAMDYFLTYLNPKPHKQTFLKPYMASAEFCASCHKVHLDVPVNHYRWVRGFNDYDNWQASGVSGQGARSFYYPQKTQACADCHMPLIDSHDPGNRDGKVHSHRFPAANTAVAYANQDQSQLQATEQFLKSGFITVDIFAVSPVDDANDSGADPLVRGRRPRRPGGIGPDSEAKGDGGSGGTRADQGVRPTPMRRRSDTIQANTTFAVGEEAEQSGPAVIREVGKLSAPIDVAASALEPGSTARVDVVVRTRKIGHFFPGGTVDSFDVWLELQATDADGRVIFWSGNVTGDGPVEPGAHFYRSYQLDAEANPINKRNAWQARSTLYVRLIPPGAADVAHYRVKVPANARGPINFTAKLNYRKFSWYYTQFVYAGEPKPGQDPALLGLDHNGLEYQFLRASIPANVSGTIRDRIPDIPIVTLAQASATVPLGQPAWSPVVRKQDRERWNDWGIGLLLQGDLKGAEYAFRKVTEAEPEYADGWLNVARALIQEGETDAAKPFIAKALEINRELGRTWFFQAAIQKADGDYDGALKSLEVARSKYPRDRVVLNQIARILFLQRKYGAAVEALKQVGGVDPEDVQMHYTLMLCYRGLGDEAGAAREEALFRRFKADEASQAITERRRMISPEDNNERQAIHDHESAVSSTGILDCVSCRANISVKPAEPAKTKGDMQ